MTSRLLALIRDIHDAHPIATESEAAWLAAVWHGHLSTLEGADDERRRLVRAGWISAVVQPLCVAVLVGVLSWLTLRS